MRKDYSLRLQNSISNPEPVFCERDFWSFDLVRYFDWWKDLSRKGLQNAMCNVSMASWLRFQGGVPLRVWDRLGVTAQEDTLLIRTFVCIGLNLNHANKKHSCFHVLETLRLGTLRF